MSSPNTREIARRLGVDDENLNIFVKHHSEPTAESVLTWAGADREHAAAVKKWLAALEAERAGRRANIDTGELCDQCNRVSVPGGEGE